MGRFNDNHEFTLVGNRPVLGPVLTGSAGLLGGYLFGRLGVWAALAIVGPFDSGDPMDLFGNAIRLLVPLLVVSVGAVAGFLVGTVIAPMLLMLGLAWNQAGRTVGYLLLLLLGVVPLTFWLLLQIGGNADGSSQGALWFAGVVVGGLTPAVARRLAIRKPPDGAASPPHQTGERS